jgi:hypothetical protein
MQYPYMKTTRLIAVSMLLAGIATLTYAGPSPQFQQVRPSAPAAVQTNTKMAIAQSQSKPQPSTVRCPARHGGSACNAKTCS